MRTNTFQLAWGLGFLVLASLACNLVSGIGDRVSDVQGTAQFVATDIQAGREVFATGRAIATQVLGSELVQTAQALATREGPGLLATAQAFATEEGPELQETIQAFATQEGPGLEGTARALATQLAVNGQAPDDIPTIPGEKENFFASEQLISYLTPLGFQEAVDFYEQQMPVYGWMKVDATSFTIGDTAVLNYEKSDRAAAITITANPGTSQAFVIISILNR